MEVQISILYALVQNLGESPNFDIFWHKKKPSTHENRFIRLLWSTREAPSALLNPGAAECFIEQGAWPGIAGGGSPSQVEENGQQVGRIQMQNLSQILEDWNSPERIFRTIWRSSLRMDILSWSLKRFLLRSKIRALLWMNGTSRLGFRLVEGQNCGNMRAGSWTRCLWLRQRKTFFTTALPSVLVRRVVNGRKHWTCLRQCWKPKWCQMPLATMLLSVLVRRVVNGSRDWTCLRQCRKPKWPQVSSATTLLSVLVRRVVNGNRHWTCLRQCQKPGWPQMSSATALPSVLVRRVVNGSRDWTCLRQCRKPKWPQMSSATTLQSVLVRRVVNGSGHWTCLR